MKSTQRFWRSLEGTPLVRGVRASWAEYVGEDLPLLEPYLRPVERLADTYPCPCPAGSGCPRGVVVHAPDEIVAYCRDRPRSCDDLPLRHEDIVVHRFDEMRLAADVAGLLGFRGDGPTAVEGLPRAFLLGTYRPMAGLEFSAYLAFRTDREEFAEVVERLVVREGGRPPSGFRPFLILSPTTGLLAGPSAERLRHAGGRVLALEEFLGADDSGRLVPTQPAEEILRAFREQVVEEARTSTRDGMAFFETPPDASWPSLRVRFPDAHTAVVEVLGARGTFHYTQMGMGHDRSPKPTKQWELLYDFARAGGVMTWTTPGADRRNQKRREYLSQNLRAFFRIPGDPIAFSEKDKGWHTRFSISL